MNESEEQSNYVVVEPKEGIIQGTDQPQFAVGDALGSGSLDKIRDILVGNQLREYDKRLARLEERLAKEYTNLREETRNRLDSLEMYIQKEVEVLTARFKKDQAERDETQKKFAQEIKDLIDSLATKIAQLDEETSTRERELRQQILSQSKSIDEQMRQKYEEILAALALETQELRNDKTDRSTLASLFAELAMRLNQ